MSTPIIISVGDPSGIGPEISVKSLKNFPDEKIFLVGSKKQLKSLIEKYTPEFKKHSKTILKYSFEENFRPNEPSKKSGSLSFKYLLRALDIALESSFPLVTAPISKELWLKAGYNYRGHTDFFENKFEKKPIMTFFSDNLKIALFTHHIPLKELWSYLNKRNLSIFIKTLDSEINNRFKLNFDFVCASINPHSGEKGVLGKEEETIIKPVINSLQNKKLRIKPPISNDTLFYKYKDKPKTMIIAFTHDIGLIPFKLLNFKKGVNVTLNLPIIRTSPDHGTAFDIAGKGIADINSIVEAIRTAIYLHSKIKKDGK